MKKPQLNELVHTAEVLKGDIKRQQLQEKHLEYLAHKELKAKLAWGGQVSGKPKKVVQKFMKVSFSGGGGLSCT